MSLCICLLVSHRCVSLLVRVWVLDVWGELVPSKIFNPCTIHSSQGWAFMSYSYICDVCMEWVNGWVSFHILSYSCLASVLCTWFSYTCISRLYVGMAPTRPLSLNKSNGSELLNTDVLSLFRQTTCTCSESASIHFNTLKVRKIHSYSESRKFLKARIVHHLLFFLLQFKWPTAKLGLVIALILS